ncbi:response regulator [Paenibacillus hamazuiensis]|uniref:response regulator n=1 Tax=Paenibacillus hamazuiensis TaxID=2936508 RepID=UPI00200E210E|nr:response regulator [Paenibacillus hamazuiensis]
MPAGKILIVEDQPNFRKGLVKIIQEGQYGWSVAGEAANGSDALDMLERVHPDLVLTDIRMPRMNGIDFIAEARLRHPELLFIFLTAYKNFEYAQSAVKMGALDYLVKPCTEEEVGKVLLKASDYYGKQKAKRQSESILKRREQVQALRAALLNLPCEQEALIQLDEILSGKELWLFRLSVQPDPYVVSEERNRDEALASAIALTEQRIQQADPEALLAAVEHNRFLLAASPQLTEQFLREAMDTIKELAPHVQIRLIRVGQAPRVKHLAGIYARVNKMAELEEGKSGGILPADPISGRAAVPFIDREVVQQLGDQLANTIALGRTDRLRELLDKLTVPAASMSAAGSGSLIEQATAYIEANYKGDCRLVDVAAHVRLNPSYFSVWFKKETGENYTRFLTRVRMEKAAVLLRNTDLKIAEIADAVGFNEPNPTFRGFCPIWSKNRFFVPETP